ncbi:hypothetical protein ACT4R9_07025 [Ornithobacterium rhinotracheale]|uniref:hypothetical protein n=1 Tax=Ornithobacterium rhinotracheale TaxID=28251 RepID=UPI003FA42F48
MKKITLGFILLSLNASLFAQSAPGRVGINTTMPKATLEVKAHVNDKAKGILIPRLTADEVKKMTEAGGVGSEQNGLLLYVDKTFKSSEDKVGKYKLIDSNGYYYWDAERNLWRKIQGEFSAKSTEYFAGKGMMLSDNVLSRDGLERVTEAEKTGWRLIGRNPQNYGNIGTNALDLSVSNVSSDTKGATGDSSVALGYGTTASGLLSTAFGASSSATGVASTAFGNETKATGVASLSAGNKSLASGLGGVSLGSETIASGDFSTAIGRKTLSVGSKSFASGLETEAKGEISTTFGNYTKAIGDMSFAVGQGGQAKGNASFVAGVYTEAIGGFETALGTYNYSHNTEAQSGRGGKVVKVDKDLQIFSIGNGYSKDSNGVSLENVLKRNAMIVMGDAKTGIGISQEKPSEMLDVGGNIRVRGESSVTVSAGSSCDKEGTITYSGGDFLGCTPRGWEKLNVVNN